MKGASKNESVKVGLRVRPLNQRESDMDSPLCIATKDNVVDIKRVDDTKQFIFDYVFGIETGQQDIYQACAFSLVETSLQGFNGTIFAYGQTGAGKTFTMVGIYKDPHLKGIIPRAFDHVISAIQTCQKKKYVVCVSFIEIYNEQVYDLLDGKGDKKKQLKENPQKGVFIKDLKSIPVKSVEQMFKILDYGDVNRSKACTAMNATSSRSHALFTLHIESIEGQEKIRGSKLNFVDLAGSQRQGKTKAEGATLKEGAKINLSLTALGNVINALVDGRTGHVPYRDSKLTRLLQDSLGGNTKTLMLASVSPAADNCDETMSTLRYAARARNIKNTPKINEDPKDTKIKEYLAEIERLRMQLGAEGENRIQQIEKIAEEKIQQKDQELMEVKKKLQEMEELVLKKEQQTPEIMQITKKRKFQKKKVQINQEINQKKLLHLQQQAKKDVQEGQDKIIQGVQEWKMRAMRLKKKLKSSLRDKQDMNQQFTDERERLMNSHSAVQLDLSFYKQIAQKFLQKQHLQQLMGRSKINEEKNKYIIPPFLMHQDKLTLPQSLKRQQVDDLWQEKRKQHRIEFVELPELGQESPQRHSKYDGDFKTTATSFIRQRKMFKPFDSTDSNYKAKIENYSGVGRQNIFFQTNRSFKISTSKDRKMSSRSFSKKDKLEALVKKPQIKKEEEKRPLSKGKYLLSPIVTKKQ